MFQICAWFNSFGKRKRFLVRMVEDFMKLGVPEMQAIAVVHKLLTTK